MSVSLPSWLFGNTVIASLPCVSSWIALMASGEADVEGVGQRQVVAELQLERRLGAQQHRPG